MPIKEMYRKGGIEDGTFCTWRAKFGGADLLDGNLRASSLR